MTSTSTLANSAPSNGRRVAGSQPRGPAADAGRARRHLSARRVSLPRRRTPLPVAGHDRPTWRGSNHPAARTHRRLCLYPTQRRGGASLPAHRDAIPLRADRRRRGRTPGFLSGFRNFGSISSRRVGRHHVPAIWGRGGATVGLGVLRLPGRRMVHLHPGWCGVPRDGCGLLVGTESGLGSQRNRGDTCANGGTPKFPSVMRVFAACGVAAHNRSLRINPIRCEASETL